LPASEGAQRDRSFLSAPQDLIALTAKLFSLIFTDRLNAWDLTRLIRMARQCMITDDNFGKASPLMDRTTHGSKKWPFTPGRRRVV